MYWPAGPFKVRVTGVGAWGAYQIINSVALLARDL